MILTIKELIRQSYNTALEKGWWEDRERNFGEQLMLMVTELAEVMEEYRRNGLTTNLDMLYLEDGKPEGIAAEFADVLIRIADTCGRYDIPLEEALNLKLKYNKTRPYRHGGKLA